MNTIIAVAVFWFGFYIGNMDGGINQKIKDEQKLQNCLKIVSSK